jgi:hypothetical protein
MSDKSKLHYYFMTESASSTETCDTNRLTTTNEDIINVNEIDGDLPTSSSSSIVTRSESQNQDSRNPNIEDTLTTATNTTDDNHQLLSNRSRLNPSKRDPGRGPQAARECLLLGPYQPITTFPIVNHRDFCPNWYKIYHWIEFSDMTKKAYCFACRLDYTHGHCDDAFTKNGFQNWSMAIQKFDKHQATLTHKRAYDSYVTAVRNHKENTDVAKLMDIEHRKKTSENRNYLKEIIRTILFLSKQGLSFRGHRENDDSLNKGNFLNNRYYCMIKFF